MNYVGSISIIDRGDAPAQAIIDKYHRSMAKRVADETKEELEAVLKRVDNVRKSSVHFYQSFHYTTRQEFEIKYPSPNVGLDNSRR